MPDLLLPHDAPSAREVEVIREAGFGTQGEDLTMGQVAYTCAMLVWSRWKRGWSDAGAAAPAAATVGRNDPCPCGSGLKFKKCCLGKAPVAPAPRPVEAAPSIPFGPELLPRLHDDEGLLADCEVLTKLFRDDEGLQRVRFDGGRALRFFERKVSGRDPATKVSPEEFDALAFEFVADPHEAKALRPVGGRLEEAAARATTAEQLRALATGVAFSTMGKLEGFVGNLLTAMIFRLSLADALGPVGPSDEVVEQIRALAKTVGTGAAPAGEIEKLMEQLPEVERVALETLSEAVADEIRQTLAAPWYPLGLSFASVVPFLLRVKVIDGSVEPRKEALRAALDKTIGEFGEEDHRLFVADLEEWLAHHPKVDALQRAALERVGDLARSGLLTDYVGDLVVAALHSMKITFLDPDDVDRLSNWEPTDDPGTMLEAFAKTAESKGYPQVAARMRSLASEIARPAAAPVVSP
jgi:hypothetical protein